MKERLERIWSLLSQRYPDTKIELNYSNPLELLIATILSAQCTDERVNRITPHLFEKYRKAEDYYQVPQEELEADIRSTGFFHNKAKNLQKCCRELVERFDGRIPDTMEELTSLAGVARKTANIVLGNAFGKPGLAVDTHVKRVSFRLGLTQQTNPDKIEIDLCRQIPEEKWTKATHLLIFHGRRTCHAKKPNCKKCVLFELCEWEDKINEK